MMAVELRNRIESDLAVSVPIVTFLEGSSLADLSSHVLSQLPTESSGKESDRMARAMQKLDQMSDEEVTALLAKKKQMAK